MAELVEKTERDAAITLLTEKAEQVEKQLLDNQLAGLSIPSEELALIDDPFSFANELNSLTLRLLTDAKTYISNTQAPDSVIVPWSRQEYLLCSITPDFYNINPDGTFPGLQSNTDIKQRVAQISLTAANRNHLVFNGNPLSDELILLPTSSVLTGEDSTIELSRRFLVLASEAGASRVEDAIEIAKEIGRYYHALFNISVSTTHDTSYDLFKNILSTYGTKMLMVQTLGVQMVIAEDRSTKES